MIVRSNYTIKYDRNKGEVNNLPSLTVPNQSYTLEELLQRHIQGMPTLGKEPIYEGESDFDLSGLRNMDLVDIQEMKMDVQHTLNEVKKEEERRQAVIDAKNKAEKAEFEAYKKEKMVGPSKESNEPKEPEKA